MKVYEGRRDEKGICHVVVTVLDKDGKKESSYPLPMREDLKNHSPTGFNWGYGGDGPSQLALALVNDLTKDDKYTMTVYQDFKNHVITKIKTDTWKRTSAELREFC